MPNKGAVAQCPFYERENQTMIFCETNFKEEGMFSARVFNSAKEKSKFKKEHCCRYPDMKCHYADYMNQIYMKGDSTNEGKNQKKEKKAGIC